ncbi:endolysin [Arthrobacter phage Anansi]|uniref:N-acetylmuramoyl-L-alanine amidase n=3 Tax=Amigovirus amigo TaxID=1982100 RepID=A0A0U4B6P5_9CAUD|nr:endolysin [Arthrobacter phage Anansi]ALY09101.1 endolysin [Arthrobacter phage Gorgeous]ALY10382.1 endolysin [Arthrobacter phage SorJuana]
MPISQTQETWLLNAVGKIFDYDRSYGYQCVDLADAYGQDIFGVPWQTSVGGVGGARELLDRVPDEYWIRIDNDPNDPNLIPERGDMVVFAGSPLNPFGHVAIVLSADGSGMWVVQQDGFAPPLQFVNGNWYSAKPAHKAWLPYTGDGTGVIAGWLRPRQNKIIGGGASVLPAGDVTGGIVTDFVIDESYTAKGFTPAAQVPAVYGGPRTIESITIHHWGALGQTHMGVVNFFCVTGPGTTSAHFVSSAGKTHCIVSPLDAAWHAGNGTGNRTSIGIECRPEATDGDYLEVAKLIAWLRSKYGDLPLIPHRDWQATACPGVWDLARLDKLARSQEVQQEDDMFTDDDRRMLKAIKDGWFIGGSDTLYKAPWQKLIDDIPRRVWDTKVTGRKEGAVSALQELADSKTNTIAILAKLDGLTEAVRQLATGQGLDPELITSTIDNAVKNALGEIRLTTVAAEVGE